MHMHLTLYLEDNCSETNFTISAVAPVRTGLQFMINAFIFRISIARYREYNCSHQHSGLFGHRRYQSDHMRFHLKNDVLYPGFRFTLYVLPHDLHFTVAYFDGSA